MPPSLTGCSIRRRWHREIKITPADRELAARLQARLAATRPASGPDEAHFPGVDPVLLPELYRMLARPPAPAAVLMPIVAREDGLSLLLTRRAAHLKQHAGQISFPGGRLEAGDAGPLEAALRETEEEIGLPRERVTVAGYLRPHLIVSGYWVVPVVGFVQPGFELRLDPLEVEEVFEVPLAHVLDPVQHGFRERSLGSITIRTSEIRFRDRLIWGATAAMVVALSRVLADTESRP